MVVAKTHMRNNDVVNVSLREFESPTFVQDEGV